jgi:hypothetical protein
MRQQRDFSADDLDRLSKLCGLFSSDHAGERSSAAAMADRFLRERGLRWPDVLAAPALPPPKPKPPPPDPNDPFGQFGGWHGAAGFCLRHRPLLTPWEVRFLNTLLDYGNIPEACTAKQRAVLRGVLEKLAAAGCEP